MARWSNLLRGGNGRGGDSDDLPGLWSRGRRAENYGGGAEGGSVEDPFLARRGGEAGMGAAPVNFERRPFCSIPYTIKRGEGLR